MAAEIYQFAVTIPAGTTADAGWSQQLAMPPRLVTAIRWRVPDGPFGCMGFAIGSSGVPILPRTSGTWIVANDDHDKWPLTVGVDSGAWEAFGYNTGSNDHTVYLTFECDLVPTPGVSPYRQPVSV